MDERFGKNDFIDTLKLGGSYPYMFLQKKGVETMNHAELVVACNHTFGSLSEFLVRYCGFRIPEGARGGREVRLVCPNHESE